MTPVNGAHHAWAMNQIMSCYGLRSPFPLSYHLKPLTKATSTLCQHCTIETLSLPNIHNLQHVREYSSQFGLKDAYTTHFTHVTFMNDLIDKLDGELMMSIEELLKRDNKQGFTEFMKKS